MKLRPVLIVTAVVLSATLLLAACGSGSQLGGTSTSGNPNTGELQYEPGADNLLLRVEQGGGLLPVEGVFTTVPGFSLYGDGTVVTVGPMLEIYPGPALPNLVVSKVSPAGVQKILQAARAAGLMPGRDDLGEPPIADASTSIFTLNVDGESHVTRAYALGYEGDSSPAGPPTDAGDGEGAAGSTGAASGAAGGSPGVSSVEPSAGPADQAPTVPADSAAPSPSGFSLTEEQQAARQRLLDFQSKLFDLRSWLGADVGAEAPYRYTAVAVLAQQVDPNAPNDSGIEPSEQDWPLADIATLGQATPLGRRFVVSGADLDTLRPALASANTITRWRSGGAFYTLAFRPLLPEEKDAPGS